MWAGPVNTMRFYSRDYVTFTWKRDIKDVMKLLISWLWVSQKVDYSDRPDLITWTNIIWVGSQSQQKSKDLKHKDQTRGKLFFHCWLWRWSGPYGKYCTWPLAAENGPWMRSGSKGTETLVPQLQETELCHNHVKLEEDPECQIRTQPGKHLEFILVRPWAENPTTPCLGFWPWTLVICYVVI